MQDPQLASIKKRQATVVQDAGAEGLPVIGKEQTQEMVDGAFADSRNKEANTMSEKSNRTTQQRKAWINVIFPGSQGARAIRLREADALASFVPPPAAGMPQPEGYEWYLARSRGPALEACVGWKLARRQGLAAQAELHRSRFMELYNIDRSQRSVALLRDLGVSAKPFALLKEAPGSAPFLISGDAADWQVSPLRSVREPVPTMALAAREIAERNGILFEHYWFAVPMTRKVPFTFTPRLTMQALRVMEDVSSAVTRGVRDALEAMEQERRRREASRLEELKAVAARPQPWTASAPAPRLERKRDPVLLGNLGVVLVEIARWL